MPLSLSPSPPLLLLVGRTAPVHANMPSYGWSGFVKGLPWLLSSWRGYVMVRVYYSVWKMRVWVIAIGTEYICETSTGIEQGACLPACHPVPLSGGRVPETEESSSSLLAPPDEPVRRPPSAALGEEGWNSHRHPPRATSTTYNVLTRTSTILVIEY